MIDFAGVAIFMQGSDDIIRSNTSSNGGIFKLTGLPYGKYGLRISYIGFEKQVVDDIEITAEHPDAYLGIIKLKKNSSSLNEVTISEKKAAVEFGADQITYNVSQSLQSEGSTATDILKKCAYGKCRYQRQRHHCRQAKYPHFYRWQTVRLYDIQHCRPFERAAIRSDRED